jgi:hypothetical protein
MEYYNGVPKRVSDTTDRSAIRLARQYIDLGMVIDSSNYLPFHGWSAGTLTASRIKSAFFQFRSEGLMAVVFYAFPGKALPKSPGEGAPCAC